MPKHVFKSSIWVRHIYGMLGGETGEFSEQTKPAQAKTRIYTYQVFEWDKSMLGEFLRTNWAFALFTESAFFFTSNSNSTMISAHDSEKELLFFFLFRFQCDFQFHRRGGVLLDRTPEEFGEGRLLLGLHLPPDPRGQALRGLRHQAGPGIVLPSLRPPDPDHPGPLHRQRVGPHPQSGGHRLGAGSPLSQPQPHDDQVSETSKIPFCFKPTEYISELHSIRCSTDFKALDIGK